MGRGISADILALLLFFASIIHGTRTTGDVYSVVPRFGSIGGGTMIHLNGRGFSSNLVDGGNVVYLVYGPYRLPCDVLELHTSVSRIVCFTRPVPEEIRYEEVEFRFSVQSNNGEGFERVSVCSRCTYRYRVNFYTPFLRDLWPLALHNGTITLKGDLYAAGFEDLDSLPDPANRDSSARDVYTRILAGGDVCSHTTEDGERYNAVISANGIAGSIECLPTLFLVSSWNMTAVLAARGNSYVSPEDYLLALDVNCVPYHYQTYADVMEVSPAMGSVCGGIRIAIRVHGSLLNNGGEDTRVVVGGVECEEVMRYQTSIRDEWIVECTTAPGPKQQAQFFPGQRSILTEFFAFTSDLEIVSTLPQSDNQVLSERVYWNHKMRQPGFPTSRFCQRTSGFFAPSKSCLYSFNLISDSKSSLWATDDEGNFTELAYSLAGTDESFWWNTESTEVSKPMWLEGGRHYYFQLVSCHGSRWHLGLAVKMHCLPLTSYPYIGDHEQQVVAIASTVIKEKQKAMIWGLPQVETLRIIPLNANDDFDFNSLGGIACAPFNLTVQLVGGAEYVVPISLESNITGDDIKQVLNFNSSVEVYITATMPRNLELAFVMGPVEFGSTFPSEVPALRLDSDRITISCATAPGDQQLLFEASLSTTQTLTYPKGFNLSLDSLRYTPTLPLGVSSYEVEAALDDLLVWQCTYPPFQADSIVAHHSYEDDPKAVRDNGEDIPRAYCGHYSKRSPGAILEDIELGPYSFVCFAYRGEFPGLYISLSYFVREFEESHTTITVSFDFDNSIEEWSYFTCIDVGTEVFTQHVGELCEAFECMAYVDQIWFNPSDRFFIDEVFIAQDEIHLLRTVPPARPHGIDISMVMVDGEVLTEPRIMQRGFHDYGYGSSSGSGSGYNERSDNDYDSSQSRSSAGSLLNPKYVMVIMEFVVTYSVRDCGVGVEPITGFHDVFSAPPFTLGVATEQISAASPGVKGTFGISIGGETLYSVEADISPELLEYYMNQVFPDQQGLLVARWGTCAGYHWVVEWKLGGDQPEMVIASSNLRGSNVHIDVTTLIHGGTWSVLRGDWLRTPETQPQVDVLVNNISSSCMAKQCSFNFSEVLTPVISEVVPSQGQGGTSITITGQGFSNQISRLHVAIGGARGTVTFVSDTTIECVVPGHAAGTYQIEVTVEGVGRALNSDGTCFTYLLTLSSVTPTTGAITGGYQVRIEGEGLLNFTMQRRPANMTTTSPWLRHGLGFPVIPNRRRLHLCPNLTREFRYKLETLASLTDCFENREELIAGNTAIPGSREQVGGCRLDLDSGFRELLNLLPMRVHIGKSPCIITEAGIDYAICTTFLSLTTGPKSIAVTVFDQEAVLMDAFSVDPNLTPIIESVSPDHGKVTGGGLLTLAGRNLASVAGANITVTINHTNCPVQFANDSVVTCIIPPNKPGVATIFVFVPSVGVAGSESILVDIHEGPLFPAYEYILFAGLQGDAVGSLPGGKYLVVHGGTFVAGETFVTIGDVPAKIVSLNPTEMVVLTPSSATTTDIHLGIVELKDTLGEFLRYQLFWSDFVARTDTITILRGDTLRFSWRANVVLTLCISTYTDIYVPPVRPLLFPAPCSGLEFTNRDSPSTNSYEHTFRGEGIYFITTHTNLDPEPMLGEVVVASGSPPLAQIRVFVLNYEANYNSSAANALSSAGNSDAGVVQKRKKRDSGGMCENEVEEEGLDEIYFVYSICVTPELHEVVPNTVSMPDAELSLHGSLLGNDTASVEVMIGNLSCIPLSSADDVVTCRLNTTATNDSSYHLPEAFVPVSVSLRVVDVGDAFVTNLTATEVIFIPVIDEILPSAGTRGGGTNVTIIGHMFSFGLDVMLGLSFPCIISEFHNTKIKCVTEAVPSTGSYNVSLLDSQVPLETRCLDASSCTYTFSDAHTPRVTSVTPTNINSPGPTVLLLEGSGFSAVLDENVVLVGSCDCLMVNATENSIYCTLGDMPAGEYPLGLEILDFATDKSLGFGVASPSASFVIVEGTLISVFPASGSVIGGTLLTIAAFGLHEPPDNTTVFIGQFPCIVEDVNSTSIQCVSTTPSPVEGPHLITVSSNSVNFVNAIDYIFAPGSTPEVTSIIPTSGEPGTMVLIRGLRFPTNPTVETVTIKIGGCECPLFPPMQVGDGTNLTCSVCDNHAGDYPVEVVVHGLGLALNNMDASFRYNLGVEAIMPSDGSFAGMNTIIVQGVGFDPDDVLIEICGQLCPLSDAPPSLYQVECVVPPSLVLTEEALSCDVVVSTVGELVVVTHGYTYRPELTPIVVSINRTRGGTQGGSALWIVVENLMGSIASVSIADVECHISGQDDTGLTCITGASNLTVCDYVLVRSEGTMMYSLSEVEFCYVDLWSSPFTWGGGPLPQEGDFVVIQRGQTLVLDVKTPILSFVLIQGKLVFDQEATDELELHSHGILITSGGCLVIGTEDDPFMGKASIVLYGDALSTELPVFGSKVLALREGCIDLHGRPINVTWTKLASTVPAGSRTLHLVDFVDWEVNGEVVIASTSFSHTENEQVTIASVDNSGAVEGVGSVVTLAEPLRYEHISVQQECAGRVITTSAEVGYLTRNVVVRGNQNEQSLRDVEGCLEDFDPGQFAVQSCFHGRFGNETVSDQFGAQIMIHPATKSQGDVFGRFEYIEVTWAGQAFRLGRYPIHFHLAGDVTGSYVRGCAVHVGFNRAVTVHGVDNLLVENNVAYNIRGHAYFLEDGNEQNNTIQDNLGIFVRGSSSLLNVDITPATFWVVNPNNIVRRNAAAGGTHFGFWYRMPEHPTGPSFDPSYCPRKQPLLEFSDNSAHSFGWYGLWVFRGYTPSPSGHCQDTDHAPAHFDRFFAWHNDKAVEFVEVGSMRLQDSILLDNKLSGVEFSSTVDSEWDEQRGAGVSGTLIVGSSNISDTCTDAGIKTPPSNYVTVSNVTFAKFNDATCYPVQACSECKFLQGGFETRYRNISFVDTKTDITVWKWEHEHVHRSLDGTLTRTDHPASLVPTSALLNPGDCPHSDITDDGNGVPGSICNPEVGLGRLAIFRPVPSSLEATPTLLSNENGEIVQQYVIKRLTGGPGYMAVVVLNKTYHLTWVEGETLTNISYYFQVSNFRDGDWIILTQHYPRELDRIFIAGTEAPQTGSIFENPESAETGSFSISEDNTTLSYIIKGTDSDREIPFVTYRCQFANCMPPPPPAPPTLAPLERPDNALLWSNNSIWPGNQQPGADEDVLITGGIYVVLDVAISRINRLEIRNGSTLELMDGMNHTIKVDLMIILGGRFVAGYPDQPFQNWVRIILHGSLDTSDYRLEDESMSAPVIGAKAIAVFGELILNGGCLNETWTLLARTAAAGDQEIEVVDTVDEWAVGDLIIITSTSYDAFQTEVFEITSNTGNVLTLNDTLRYSHVAVDTHNYSVRAEVGLLSRRITIEPGEPDQAEEVSFGCRVLVSSSSTAIGVVILSEVEFKQCGQIGFTSDDDPRFALALLNIGETQSSIKDCSFHDGYNTALGIFSTASVEVSNNVIHGTVGPSMIIKGSEHNVTHNLASLSHFIGTYKERNDPFNALWTANFEITKARGIYFRFNHAAGGAKAGIHTNGEECEGNSSTIRDNVAHSVLHCVHLGYGDGDSSGCSLFPNYTLYSCYHYALFSYSRAGVVLRHSTLAWNKAGVYISVIGPSAISHIIGDKPAKIQDTVIVSANPETRCKDDETIPAIANHETSHNGLQSPTNGHVGIIVPSFVSGHGHFPSAPWFSIISYPAIAGVTEVTNVTFVNFGEGCNGDTDVMIMPNRLSEDCNHPVHMRGVKFYGSSFGQKLYLPIPNVNRVNPSDCVDMDCDGHKEVLLKDFDGTFTETGVFHTIISKAEFEWDGDPQRGLGDYRIPTAMLTQQDGTLLDADDLYPEKGIVRSGKPGADCAFVPDWNAYRCRGLDHLMLVMESLDADTEVRRLSPIALGAGDYVNLVNGPMDNGWCGGYTCQERISTFYAVVCSDLEYTIALTSTNPQNFALHLLNSDDNHVIVVGIIHNTPQRLDVFVRREDGSDEYVPPNNAMLVSGNLQYMDGPEDSFIPTLSESHGANFYDGRTKRIYVTVRGPNQYTIRVTPVIVLSFDIQVTADTFFDEATLVRNLALLFGITETMVRTVDVVRESRRRREGTEVITATVQIGSSPSNDTSVDGGSEDSEDSEDEESQMAEGTLPTEAEPLVIYDVLEFVAMTLELGGLDELFDPTEFLVLATTLIRPAVPVTDPTNGVRATPETGGPQPGPGVDLPTFYDQQRELELLLDGNIGSFLLSIPSYLFIVNELALTAVEGLPSSSQLALAVTMHNVDGSLSLSLGDIITWTLTVSLVSGPDSAFLTGVSTNFAHGRATFENLTFSHPGEYFLEFFVTYPLEADFYVASHIPVVVTQRDLGLRILQQPRDGNVTFELFPYPTVELVDLSNDSSRVSNHTWRDTVWFVEVLVEGNGDVYRVPLTNGVVTLNDLHIYSAGSYDLAFVMFHIVDGNREYLDYISSVSDGFSIIEVPLTRFLYAFEDNFDSVVGDDVTEFGEGFREWFLRQFPRTEVANLTVTRARTSEARSGNAGGLTRPRRADGGIEVSLFVTARDRGDLIDAIAVIRRGPDPDSPFVFGDVLLVPSSVTQDPTLPVMSPSSGSRYALYLTLATIIPAIVFFVGGALTVLLGLAIYKKLYRHKVSAFTYTVEPSRNDDNLELTQLMSAPPPYQSRPSTPGATSLTKAPFDFYVNPAVINVVETSTDDDGYKTITATEGTPHAHRIGSAASAGSRFSESMWHSHTGEVLQGEDEEKGAPGAVM